MTYLTQGIVLRRDHLSECDRRYVIYTKELGKISAIAKGAKKIISKLNSHLDYFCIANLMLAKGSNCERIASAQIQSRFPSIVGNSLKSTSAFYFCEVSDSLIKFTLSDGKTFQIMEDFYSALDGAQNKNEVLLALNASIFELLKRLGYEPEITAKNQKQLLFDLNKLIQYTAEKEVKSFEFLYKFFT